MSCLPDQGIISASTGMGHAGLWLALVSIIDISPSDSGHVAQSSATWPPSPICCAGKMTSKIILFPFHPLSMPQTLSNTWMSDANLHKHVTTFNTVMAWLWHSICCKYLQDVTCISFLLLSICTCHTTWFWSCLTPVQASFSVLQSYAGLLLQCRVRKQVMASEDILSKEKVIKYFL